MFNLRYTDVMFNERVRKRINPMSMSGTPSRHHQSTSPTKRYMPIWNCLRLSVNDKLNVSLRDMLQPHQ